MRGLPSTIALVLVAAGLGAYIYVTGGRDPARETREKVFAVEAGAIEEITIETGDETTVLQKRDGAWRLTAPVDTEADETETSTLTSQLASLELNRVVEEDAAELAEYGLETPRVAVSFRAGETRARLRIGDTTPTGSDVYATLDGSRRVFLLSSYLENTFRKAPFDLRDKRLLRIPRDQVEAIEITEGGRTIRFAKSEGDWRLEQPYRARGDYGTIEGLLTRLVTSPMAAVVAEQAEALAPYGLDRPVQTVRVIAGSATAVLHVGREDDGRRLARDESRRLVFAIDRTLAEDLARNAEAYRNKDVFDFRLYNAERAVVTREGRRVELAKQKDEESGSDVWRRVGGPEVHASVIEDLLSKLSNLRAQSFSATTASTGLDTPVLEVEVTFDQGRTERVVFGRSANEVVAARADEPGAARLDTAAFDGVLEALRAVEAEPSGGTGAR